MNKINDSALILLNLQIDYCPGGAMEVPNGDLILPLANQLMAHFQHNIAAIDWHPANHISFAGNHPWRHIGQTISIDGIEQELLPFHCVKDSFGAHFHPALDKEKITKIFHQGTEANIDEYSCFFDVENRRKTGLLQFLTAQKIKNLFFIGLPLDGAVKHSVLDAITLDFNTCLIEDACKAWNKREKEGKLAIKEMEKAGATILKAERILNYPIVS